MAFDPFDERHRNKAKRRKPEEVAADRRNWQSRVDNNFRRVLDEIGWPDYIDSECVLSLAQYNPETNLDFGVLRRNFRASMERLGYDKFVNEKSKDGRWVIYGVFLVVYSKRGSAKVARSELKQALGR